MAQTLATHTIYFSWQQLDGNILTNTRAKAYKSFTYQSPKHPDEKAPWGLKQKSVYFTTITLKGFVRTLKSLNNPLVFQR